MSATAVGFVTPPRWVSPSTIEMPAVVEAPIVPQQCFPDLPGFGYTLAELAAAAPAVERAAHLLGQAGCAAIGMEGTPFAWAGCPDEAAARARVSAAADAARAPVVMAGTAIIDGLRALGVQRVSLCPTYYPRDWRDGWRGFVGACGLGVDYCGTMADSGATAAIERVADYGWSTGSDQILDAVSLAAESAPAAEAIVVTGAGCRTTPIIGELEAAAGRPVVGADSALFWALARAADLELVPGALGALTAAR